MSAACLSGVLLGIGGTLAVALAGAVMFWLYQRGLQHRQERRLLELFERANANEASFMAELLRRQEAAQAQAGGPARAASGRGLN